MSAARLPASPPELPGFTYRELLGSGGFADVFLYDQALPQRRVAVKVLLADRLSQGSLDDFAAEANIMAQLSTHPAIVTIYQAGVSDDGRPYLVMEYCSRPNLQARYRREPFSLAEALRVGVQVAAAVETAHRAGILHRDIKPANILVTEYNRPALTDFGIATAADTDAELTGMSIPWSPPEAFAEAGSPGVAGDVYALGATVYTLLAGRSPFELPGERNGSADLIQRALTMALPPLGRADAPASLQRVLERSMATAPADRYASALDFARALQRVQLELNMAATPIDVIDDSAPEAHDDDDDGALTRIRGIVSIDPSLPPPVVRPSGATAPVAATTAPPAGTTVGATMLRPGAGVPVWQSAPPEATVRRSAPLGALRDAAPAPAFHEPAPAGVDAAGGHTAPADPAASDGADGADGAEAAPARPRRTGALVGGILAAVVVLGGAGIAVAAGAGLLAPAPEPSAAPADEEGPVDILPGGGVPAVAELTGTVEGDRVVFAWRNGAAEEGDSFLWGVQRLGEDTKLQSTTDTTVTVPAEPGGRTCIEVTLVRADRQSSPTAEVCAS
ncbi:serine/threonine protein kinase [Microbacterium sp. zg.Y1090]|uniref:serine/threonine-protein kinase n=1 Tax=Microbacterium TaxID=33882 RepID=UPI00214D0157|nr:MULTISPECIES: serine/threonine-protein kinase [unclassified Microbacterium]MCR2813154.1 serine/threonine protein kinase [Microbacterium sp. zg.Y1084]MCR2819467.1 serine/threonine protein kinase [Microbacterium sp. zg.Y1090]MDL5487321.1 serine/threonine-protein kinase [Microbacterium sp. zg-Y1211]WIM28441.1 serine/threonine-protein kinase [Microbacterium sp. zg-Y1090]